MDLLNIQWRNATANDLRIVKVLLENEGLPSSDLDLDKIDLFLFSDGDRELGIAGLEISGQYALLRSMVVLKALQRKGIGQQILKETISIAEEKGIIEVFLLTETAGIFFRKEGFKVSERELAPAFIKSTEQFSSLCPASAEFLSRKIG